MKVIECVMLMDGFAENPGIDVAGIARLLGREFLDDFVNQALRISIRSA